MPLPPDAIADAHSDLLTELDYAAREHSEANPFRSRWLPQLVRGGVRLQVCAVYVDPTPSTDAGLRAALRQIRAFHAAVEANGDAVVGIRRQAQLDQVGDRRALVLALEGVDYLGGDPELIDLLVDLGVRIVSLTHNHGNAFAGGCATETGLSPAGERLVDRLLELGVLIDLAHASDATFAAVLARAPTGAVLVSHAGCRALHDLPRNVSDEQLRALAAHGGVLGLMPHPYAVDRARHDIDRFIDHVDHAVDVMGIEHVALGGDFLPQIVRALGITEMPGTDLAPDAALAGLDGPQDYPVLVARLRERGYDGPELAALLRDNLLGLLRRGLPA